MTDYDYDIKKDLYNILGCLPNSSSEEIKQAYHRKILESHPDKNENSHQNIKIFHDVKAAWEILGNTDRRRKYDAKFKQIQLEAEGELIYANLLPNDLEETEDIDTLSYQCRCGNSYIVQKTDLEQTNCVLHIPCQECTFVIAVET
ncbi:PREDICTED: dnaJ homolog subfamily C member 24-like [Ceratosolen solmsi marchali]|uniref:DnaJ homolog subfamily C member 24-like n=1 Tax=Ceratosolen solmsi marchali TaxID=326594 RepID=A0AAJ6YK94_9HYME|nr:PREDICTED: dnaJ homolog subfamily C member 24-like [Ceratosolen solmsi marchali]